LILDGLHDLLVAVPYVANRNARKEVQISLTVDGIDIAPAGLLYHHLFGKRSCAADILPVCLDVRPL
jgi:hypothetical protein